MASHGLMERAARAMDPRDFAERRPAATVGSLVVFALIACVAAMIVPNLRRYLRIVRM